ncbi:CU044_5270 family protein [Micromonospora sp. SL1-18]|uniref:CU044_5270 family protein n=1 Tax=Micromonospora sp. SL1-18 TaxID=3399128 RepID=UPI003A4DD778
MHTKQQVRDLLGPADPARGVALPPASLSAHDVILRAETSAPPAPVPARRRTSRRTVLVGAAVAAAAVASAGLVPVLRDGSAPTRPTRPVDGIVLQPVGYEIATDAEPAGPHLRALAGRITAAPYDREGGRYAYHRLKSWGGNSRMSDEGHVLSSVEERRSWDTPDGRRWTDETTLGMEFPDAASRDYWTKQLPAPAVSQTAPPPAGPVEEPRDPDHPDRNDWRLPSDRAALARWLGTDLPAFEVAGGVFKMYYRFLVPRRTRADILTMLADKPGFVWRGRVVDRAGRPGLAVTAEYTLPAGTYPERAQELLIFDPNTGELLAEEYLELAPRRRVLHYGLLLEASRTDTLG